MPTLKSSAPLKGKLVFLDTKAPALKLRNQLESLGARVENFFSKDIWCVITDKQIHEAHKGLLCSTASSQSKQRTPFLNRTQVLLQAAQQQKKEVKRDDEVQTVVQECKQWDIPLLSMKTASNSVSKLIKKYQPEPVKHKSHTTPLRKVVSDSQLGKSTRLEGEHIIKLEDKRQLYRPVYKTYTAQTYPEIKVAHPKSGSAALLSPFATAMDEREASKVRTCHESRKRSSPHDEDTDKAAKKQRTQSKNTNAHKQIYCEVCHECFTSLRKHLVSAVHQKAAAGCLKQLEDIVNEFQSNDVFEFTLSGSSAGNSPQKLEESREYRTRSLSSPSQKRATFSQV